MWFNVNEIKKALLYKENPNTWFSSDTLEIIKADMFREHPCCDGYEHDLIIRDRATGKTYHYCPRIDNYDISRFDWRSLDYPKHVNLREVHEYKYTKVIEVTEWR